MQARDPLARVSQLLETIDDVRRYNSNAICGSWSAADHVRRPHAIGQEVLADIETQYDLPVLPPVSRSVRFAEAPGAGRSVLSTARRSRGAQTYRRVGGPDDGEQMSDRPAALRRVPTPGHTATPDRSTGQTRPVQRRDHSAGNG